MCVCLSVYDVCVETLQKSVISYFFGREALISEAVYYRLAVLQASRPLSYLCLSSWECLLIPRWLRASGLQLWGVKGHQGKMDVLETNTSYFAVLPKVSLAACLLQAFSLMTHFFFLFDCVDNMICGFMFESSPNYIFISCSCTPLANCLFSYWGVYRQCVV